MASASLSAVKSSTRGIEGVEFGDGDFVVGAEAGGHGDETFLHLLGGLGGHVVIDEQHGRERRAIGGKHVDALLDVVFEDAELVLAEVGGQPTGGVFHGDRNEDEIGTDANGALGIGEGAGGADCVCAGMSCPAAASAILSPRKRRGTRGRADGIGLQSTGRCGGSAAPRISIVPPRILRGRRSEKP